MRVLLPTPPCPPPPTHRWTQCQLVHLGNRSRMVAGAGGRGGGACPGATSGEGPGERWTRNAGGGRRGPWLFKAGGGGRERAGRGRAPRGFSGRARGPGAAGQVGTPRRARRHVRPWGVPPAGAQPPVPLWAPDSSLHLLSSPPPTVPFSAFSPVLFPLTPHGLPRPRLSLPGFWSGLAGRCQLKRSLFASVMGSRVRPGQRLGEAPPPPTKPTRWVRSFWFHR